MDFQGNIHQIASTFGMDAQRFLSYRLDTSARSVRRLDAVLERLDARLAPDQGLARMDSKTRKDNASAFLGSALEEMLGTIERVSNENYLFVPGMTGDRAPLLPVQQRVAWGKTEASWTTVGLTGEARHVGAGGLNSLTHVGSSDDKKSQPVSMYGVRMKWDQFELWQAGHLDRDIPGENRRAMMMAMAERMERNASFGVPELEKPGFFNTGQAFTMDLLRSFGDPQLTFDQCLEQLSIIDISWGRANPSRRVSGVVMPKTHANRIKRLFRGTDGDRNAWQTAVDMFPWLANIIEDDRLLTAGPSDNPILQLFSADSEELYFESTPSPALFGPFEITPMQTDFIALAQDAGAMNKRYERIMRFNQPSV